MHSHIHRFTLIDFVMCRELPVALFEKYVPVSRWLVPGSQEAARKNRWALITPYIYNGSTIVPRDLLEMALNIFNYKKLNDC